MATSEKSNPVAVVTGGAGFIGSHMVDLLVAQGYEVRVIDNLAGGREANLAHHASNGQVRAEFRDIRDFAPGDPLFAGAKYVFHFAGIGDIVPSIEQPTEYMAVNVQGTVRMLECARHAGAAKFVYAASSSCYGLAQVPTSEDHPISPQYPYALSKYLGELAVLHWHRVYRATGQFHSHLQCLWNAVAHVRCLRCGIRRLSAGKSSPESPSRSSETVTQKRDFLYGSDVAERFLARRRDRELSGGVYNVGAGARNSVNRLVELLKGEVVHMPKRPGEPECTWADISRIKNELGWSPKISFEEGVRRVVANIDYWREAPLWDVDSIGKATESWFKYLGGTNVDHA